MIFKYYSFELKSPVTAEQNSSSCFSAPLEFTAHLPMVGFVPGQMICMEIHVDNKDRKNNYEFTVKLVKVIAIILIIYNILSINVLLIYPPENRIFFHCIPL